MGVKIHPSVLFKGMNNMEKFKRYIFDVEMIIDYNNQQIMNEKIPIATHRIFRGITQKELIDLIQNNQVPKECKDIQITFNIRGVNY